MAGDELNEPLGRNTRAPVSRRRRVLAAGFGAAVVLAVCAGLILVFAANKGGEPFAVAAIAPASQPTPLKTEDREATGSIRQMPTAETHGTENGVIVHRPGDGEKRRPSALVIKVPEALGQSEILPVDRRLIEQSRYGPLPKISVEGIRARDLYARPLVFSGPIEPGTPRIALVIGGLGSNPAAAEDSLLNLPAAITLAISPYGDNRDAAVKRATAVGHETLLRIPFDNGGQPRPGPHVLTAKDTPTETLDNLHWLMSRASGYVGVLGSASEAFSTDRVTMTTLSAEVDERGLLYVDGSLSKQSVGPDVARTDGVASRKVDVLLDASANPSTLRAGLARLEAIARAKGAALGLIDDIPSDIGAITQFTDALAAKGFVLVPVSALATRPAPPLAVAP